MANLGNVLSTIGNIGSAFSPFAGIASAIGGLFGQSSQNEKQLQATRETNEMNYKIWQEQQQHNVDMFNLQNDANIANWQMQNDANVKNWQMQFDKTNAYNTASAQRQRLEDAGLNPYIMMNGSSAGVAQSSGVSSANMNGATAQPAQAPQMQAPHPSAFTDPIGQALQQMQQSLIATSQATKNLVDSAATAVETPVNVENTEADTDKKVAETDNYKVDTDLKNIQKYWQPKLFEQDKIFKDRTNQGLFWQNSIIRNQALLSDLTFNDELEIKRATRMNLLLDNATKMQLLQYMPQQQAAELELLAMQAYQAFKAGKCSEQQAKYFITGQILNKAQTGYYNQLGGYYSELTRGVRYDNDFNYEKFQRFGEKMFEAAGVAIDLEIATNKNSTDFENMLNKWHINNPPSDFMKWNYFNYRHLGVKPYLDGKFDFSGDLGIPGLDVGNNYHLNVSGGIR